MSSIRLFILGSLDQRGPMHGHGLLLLAEEEHIDLWTDFAASAVYGAMKRLAAEGLIVEDRVERQGNYPERQVYRISDAGRIALHDLRRQGLVEIVIKPDPVDLALARLDPEGLDELPVIIEERLARLRTHLEEYTTHLEEVDKYLSVAEVWSMRHQLSRWRGEVAWHEELLTALPDIITDEKELSTKGHD
ncbi:PadR family transcriptional regulator [Glaciihabitans sp. UYNi722]|uniref:PadR family transcriptional regulator n=1 Tax=Glaciihabitans sp. UYNi722 TaxID=3156344 RepID=UPI0033931C62